MFIKHNRFGVQWFFEEADKGGGNAGGGGSNGGNGNDDDKARRNLQSLLDKKSGDGVALAADLLSENAELRSKNRELKTKVAPDDAVVLSKEDAAKWTAFNELGTPDEVKTKIADSQGAVSERDALKAEKVIAKAAALSGYKADVLGDLAKSKGFTLEVEGEGENAKVNVKWKDGDKDVQNPLSEYVDSTLAAYLPSLQAEVTAPMGKPVVVFPRGAAPGGGKTTNEWDRIRAEKQAKAEAANVAPAKSWTEQVGIAT